LGLLVVGSVALDTVETPFDKIDNALGGSATFISLAASYFTAPIHLVAVVGTDFPKEHLDLLEDHNIDLQGLQVEEGKTFRWGGKYHFDLNVRDTLFTHLGVFEKFDPQIPEKLRRDNFILLGNIAPTLQLKVLEQVGEDAFIVCDTMNLWIDTMLVELKKVIKKTDVLIINDSEARMLTSEANLIIAAKKIRAMGPEYLIIKKGEHGAMLFNDETVFSAPAYPLEKIYDPTGAGDTFAGGFTGYLHKMGDVNFENLKRAVIYGSTLASFCVEKFSTKGIENLDPIDIKTRFTEFRDISLFSADQ
jgi:sugar/nucleoside kinase (ribokinase family)